MTTVTVGVFFPRWATNHPDAIYVPSAERRRGRHPDLRSCRLQAPGEEGLPNSYCLNDDVSKSRPPGGTLAIGACQIFRKMMEREPSSESRSDFVLELPPVVKGCPAALLDCWVADGRDGLGKKRDCL